MNRSIIKKREYQRPIVNMTAIEMESQLLAGTNEFHGGNKPAEEGDPIGDAKRNFFDEQNM
mgnify:FL=1